MQILVENELNDIWGGGAVLGVPGDVLGDVGEVLGGVSDGMNGLLGRKGKPFLGRDLARPVAIVGTAVGTAAIPGVGYPLVLPALHLVDRELRKTYDK